MSDNDKADSGPDNCPPTVLGWIARIVSVALITILAATIAYQAMSEDHEIRFETEIAAGDMHQQDGMWFIPVDVLNDGSRTAHSVDLELTVGAETTAITIERIGANETIRFVVTRQARSETVEHKVISYEAS